VRGAAADAGRGLRARSPPAPLTAHAAPASRDPQRVHVHSFVYREIQTGSASMTC